MKQTCARMLLAATLLFGTAWTAPAAAITWYELAIMAEAAYPKKRGDESIVGPADRAVLRNYDLLFAHDEPMANGFSAAVFERGDDIIVAIAGTDEMVDVITDAQLANWFAKNTQLVHAHLNSAQRLVQRHINSGKRVTVVGHSLGGFITQVVTTRLNGVHRGYTFNAPGVVKPSEYNVSRSSGNTRKIKNYSSERDLVGNYGKHLGIKLPVHDVIKGNSPKGHRSNHGITGFKNDLRNGMLSFAALINADPVFHRKQLKSKDSKKCVQIGKPLTEGKNARIRKCNSDKWNQEFTLRENGIVTVGVLKGKDYGKPRCLESKGTSKGDTIQIGECHGMRNQRWYMDGDRLRQLKPRFSGNRMRFRRDAKSLCADVKGARNSSGTRLILWSCHSKKNQKWDLL